MPMSFGQDAVNFVQVQEAYLSGLFLEQEDLVYSLLNVFLWNREPPIHLRIQ